MSRLPTRAQWDDACRAAAANRGVWQQVGDSVWGACAGETVSRQVAVPGDAAGERGSKVDELELRLQVLRAVGGPDDPLRSGLKHALFGYPVPLINRARLHARCDHPTVTEVARRDAEGESVPPEPSWWLATTWRHTYVLLVPGGREAHDQWAPGDTTALPLDDLLLVHHMDRWDRVTAALVDAHTSGGNMLAAALAALGRTKDDGRMGDRR